MVKIKNLLILIYWDLNNTYEQPMSQNIPADGFRWVEDIFYFIKGFIENYNEESDIRYFQEVDVQYLYKMHDLHNDLLFFIKRMNIEKVEKHVAKFHDKKDKFYTYKSFKIIITSWISTEQRTQSH